jgi:hypothetical protein
VYAERFVSIDNLALDAVAFATMACTAHRTPPSAALTKAPDVPNSPLNRARNIEWLIFDSVRLAARPKHITDYYRAGRRGLLPDFPLGSSTQRAHQDFMAQEEDRLAALRGLGLK